MQSSRAPGSAGPMAGSTPQPAASDAPQVAARLLQALGLSLHEAGAPLPASEALPSTTSAARLAAPLDARDVMAALNAAVNDASGVLAGRGASLSSGFSSRGAAASTSGRATSGGRHTGASAGNAVAGDAGSASGLDLVKRTAARRLRAARRSKRSVLPRAGSGGGDGAAVSVAAAAGAARTQRRASSLSAHGTGGVEATKGSEHVTRAHENDRGSGSGVRRRSPAPAAAADVTPPQPTVRLRTRLPRHASRRLGPKSKGASPRSPLQLLAWAVAGNEQAVRDAVAQEPGCLDEVLPLGSGSAGGVCMSALHMAVAQRCASPVAVELLLRCGASPDVRGYRGRTPLFLALQYPTAPEDAVPVASRPAYVRSALGAGRSVDRDARHLRIVKALVQHKANLHQSDDRGYTLLHAVCMGRQARQPLLEYLLAPAASADSRSAGGQGGGCGLRSLVDTEADDGMKPVHLAARHAHPDLVRTLVAHGADVHAVVGSGAGDGSRGGASPTASTTAAVHVCAACGEAAVNAGVDEVTGGAGSGAVTGMQGNALLRAGDSALHVATVHGALATLTHLVLNEGMDVNKTGLHGDTALHLAAYCGDLGAIQTLLVLGADTEVRNSHLLRAFDIASGDCRVELALADAVHPHRFDLYGNKRRAVGVSQTSAPTATAPATATTTLPAAGIASATSTDVASTATSAGDGKTASHAVSLDTGNVGSAGAGAATAATASVATSPLRMPAGFGDSRMVLSFDGRVRRTGDASAPVPTASARPSHDSVPSSTGKPAGTTAAASLRPAAPTAPTASAPTPTLAPTPHLEPVPPPTAALAPSRDVVLHMSPMATGAPRVPASAVAAAEQLARRARPVVDGTMATSGQATTGDGAANGTANGSDHGGAVAASAAAQRVASQAKRLVTAALDHNEAMTPTRASMPAPASAPAAHAPSPVPTTVPATPAQAPAPEQAPGSHPPQGVPPLAAVELTPEGTAGSAVDGAAGGASDEAAGVESPGGGDAGERGTRAASKEPATPTSRDDTPLAPPTAAREVSSSASGGAHKQEDGGGAAAAATLAELLLEHTSAGAGRKRHVAGCARRNECAVCSNTSSVSGNGTAASPLLRCSRCKAVFYCSKQHQSVDWKVHKRLCRRMAMARLDQDTMHSAWRWAPHEEWTTPASDVTGWDEYFDMQPQLRDVSRLIRQRRAPRDLCLSYLRVAAAYLSPALTVAQALREAGVDPCKRDVVVHLLGHAFEEAAVVDASSGAGAGADATTTEPHVRARALAMRFRELGLMHPGHRKLQVVVAGQHVPEALHGIAVPLDDASQLSVLYWHTSAEGYMSAVASGELPVPALAIMLHAPGLRREWQEEARDKWLLLMAFLVTFQVATATTQCTELALQAFAEQVVQQRLPLTRVCSKVNPFRALAERTTPDNSLVQDHAYLLVYRHDSARAHPTAARKE